MIPFPRNSLLLAPMVGITNRAFRTFVHEMGDPDWYTTEMASAEAFLSGGRNESVYPICACPRARRYCSPRAVRFRLPPMAAMSKVPAERRPRGSTSIWAVRPPTSKAGRGAALLDNVLWQKRWSRPRVRAGRAHSPQNPFERHEGERGHISGQIVAEAASIFSSSTRVSIRRIRHKADHVCSFARKETPIRHCNMGTFDGRRVSFVLASNIHRLRSAPPRWRNPAFPSAAGRARRQTRTPTKKNTPISCDRLRYIDLVETLFAGLAEETCRRGFRITGLTLPWHHLKFSLINEPSLDEMRSSGKVFDEVLRTDFECPYAERREGFLMSYLA